MTTLNSKMLGFHAFENECHYGSDCKPLYALYAWVGHSHLLEQQSGCRRTWRSLMRWNGGRVDFGSFIRLIYLQLFGFGAPYFFLLSFFPYDLALLINVQFSWLSKHFFA